MRKDLTLFEQLSDEQIDRFVELREKGMSCTKIAEAIGITEAQARAADSKWKLVQYKCNWHHANHYPKAKAKPKEEPKKDNYTISHY